MNIEEIVQETIKRAERNDLAFLQGKISENIYLANDNYYQGVAALFYHVRDLQFTSDPAFYHFVSVLQRELDFYNFQLTVTAHFQPRLIPKHINFDEPA